MENDDAKKVDATVVGDSNLSDDSKPLMIFTSEEDINNAHDSFNKRIIEAEKVSKVLDNVDIMSKYPVGCPDIRSDLLVL